MRKALITLVVVISVGAAVATWHAHQPRHTPSGQPPLDSLNPQNLADFRKMFNSSASSVRLVLLLSPHLTRLSAGGLRDGILTRANPRP